MVRYRVMEFCCAKIQKHEMKYIMTEVLKYETQEGDNDIRDWAEHR